LLTFLEAGYAGLGVTQVALLTLWALPGATRTRASIPAQVLDVIATLTLCLLSYAEHSYSVRPSFLLNGYLFITLLFDIAHARTLWLRPNESHNMAIAMVSTVAIALKLGLLLLEELEKKGILRPACQTYPPEATAGVFSKGFFWWLNPLFRRGFSGIVTVDDLFPLDKKLVSARHEAKIGAAWSKGITIFQPVYYRNDNEV
jgi:ATP-binding cassette, subfamily C (CFTR/MRP), member 1